MTVVNRQRPLRTCCFRNQRRRDRNRHSNSESGDGVPARAHTLRDFADRVSFSEKSARKNFANARELRFQGVSEQKCAQFLPALSGADGTRLCM